MSDSNLNISFPCFTGLYVDPPGNITAVVNCEGKRCLGLFTAPGLVEQFFRENLSENFVGTSLDIVSFKVPSELFEYLHAHRQRLVVQNVFHWVTDPKAKDRTVPKEIFRLLVQIDGDRFMELIRHKPHHDWLEETVGDLNFSPILPSANVVDLGSFFLRPDGSVRIAEGRDLIEGPDGWFYLTEDEGDSTELMSSKCTVVTWGGCLVFLNDKFRLHFVFEANDDTNWEYKYDMAEGNWYERKLSENAYSRHPGQTE